MRIITASSAAEAPAASIPNSDDSLPGELAQYHPAQSLFTVTPLKANASEITLRLHWRHPDLKARTAVQGALGCVVDYAARLAAQSLLDQCDLSECELHVCKPFSASSLLVTTRIDYVQANCAIYHCEVYVREVQQNVLVAHSEGTLLKRSGEPSRSTQCTSGV